MATEVYFSKSRYDHEGDVIEDGIFLHFGDTIIRVAEDAEDFGDFAKRIQLIETEILGND